jgi:hypothetical protein
MNKKQFDKLAESLYDRGYKRYNQHWHHEDFVIGKGFHKKDNKWDDERYAYQIGLSVYDYTLHPEWNGRLPENMRDYVGIEIHIDVSRTIDERIDFIISWRDDTKIEEVEATAESFYKWVCNTYPEPPKD